MPEEEHPLELELFPNGEVSSCAVMKSVAAEMIMKIAVIADDEERWKVFVENYKRLNTYQPPTKC